MILVRIETSPDDIHGMHAAKGILTARGGMTSHAAVVTRGMGKACVCGAGDVSINYAEGAFTARARHVDALAIARGHLAQARVELDHEALDLAAESLRLAHDALGEITGRVHADDLLGHIFSSFCIGK